MNSCRMLLRRIAAELTEQCVQPVYWPFDHLAHILSKRDTL